MKKIFTFLVIFISIFSQAGFAQPLQHGCDPQLKTKVILIGDSWASFTWTYKAYRESFRKFGYADMVEDGLKTTMIGAQAESFLDIRVKSKVKLALNTHTDAEAVVIFLGGNDVTSSWNAGEPYDNIAIRSAEVAKQLDTIITYIRETRPDIRIIVSSYDYPNFVEPLLEWPENPYYDFWEGLGFPTPQEANEALIFGEGLRARWCDSIGVDYLLNLGLMQYIFGQKDPLPVPPYGTYPPKSVPFPFGDPRYPSPQEAMGLLGIDAYHLGPEGYFEIANNAMREFLLPMWKRDPQLTIRSVQANDGWVNSNGLAETDDIKIGVNQEGHLTKGLVTFNTADIPDNAVITHASLFITRKRAMGDNPIEDDIFPSNTHIDIKTGTFGAPQPETSDLTAQADMEDAGCFVGTAYKNDFAFRVDLKEEALQYLNKEGLTQFRLSFDRPNSSTSLGIYYNGGETEPYYAPYLDIYYTVISPVPGNKTADFKLYPNPASNVMVMEGLSQEEAAGLKVYNSAGDLLQVPVSYEGAKKIRIETGQLQPGAYFIQVAGYEGKTSFVKL